MALNPLRDREIFTGTDILITLAVLVFVAASSLVTLSRLDRMTAERDAWRTEAEACHE